MRFRGAFAKTAVAAAFVGMAAIGPTLLTIASPAAAGMPGAPVTLAQGDPGCEAFGWRHPVCAGGAWDQSASSEWGPSSSTEAGLDAVSEVPNVDGSMSPPGTPGAI